jgi:hypothetical protein
MRTGQHPQESLIVFTGLRIGGQINNNLSKEPD